jgi:hypothetical protein
MTVCPKCGTTSPSDSARCPSCGADLLERPPIDRYTLEGVLGRGASSVVYRAIDARTGEPVAVKALNPELLANPGARERLREEAEVLQQLSHDNVVRVVELVESERGAWLVTDAVEGASLRTVLVHAHELQPEQALAIFTGVLAGLAYAHGRGVVHGDLKPENVIVEASGTAKLVDFGQSVRSGQPTTGGTAAYMSPEAIRGEPVGPPADLYAVGAMLYEALTGRPPFLATTEDALLNLQLNEPPPPIEGLPAAIATLVSGLLEKDAGRRPASAAEALSSFETAVREAYGTEWRRRAGVADLVQSTATRFPTLSAATPAAAGTPAGSPFVAPPAAPADADLTLAARGIRALRWIAALQLSWLLAFGGGAFWLVWSFGQNGQAEVNCFSGLGSSCGGHRSLVAPIVLIVVSFIGFALSGILASTWAAKKYGVGVVTALRRRRSSARGPGFPGAAGWPGMPPAGWPGGMPPGTPGI